MKTITKIDIAIVDDHSLFRSGIASLLCEFNDINIVFQAKNGADFQQKITQYPSVEVVLMDINMPVLNGYETTKWTKQNHPSIQILALSMNEDDQSIINMLKAGASGYILKESQVTELRTAIIQIIEKGFYTNDIVSGNMIRSFHQKNEGPNEQLKLTQKEILFLQLCASELTYKEMADQMEIAVRSVDNYSRNLFEKTGTKSRIGLVLWAIKNNLITT